MSVKYNFLHQAAPSLQEKNHEKNFLFVSICLASGLLFANLYSSLIDSGPGSDFRIPLS
jgi:hypothetical protein